MTFTDRQQRLFDQIEGIFEAHGYIVTSEPIPGMEDVFLNALQAAATNVVNQRERNLVQYGFRGLSKRALAALHADLPEPAFGVEVR